MKPFKKMSKRILILAMITIMTTPIISVGLEAPIDFGTAKGFALLAGQTITNTGTTVINGNVGISPGSSFTQGPAVINGSVHINDTIAIKAKEDLITAFNDAAGRNPVITIPSELGGSTLTPGYYTTASGTFELTGTLTLDAGGDPNAVFVFMAASTLITATSSNVNLINGADDSQIFWKVGSSATLGITSHFEGTIMALESITLTTGATINGALFARNGSVTLDSNTINTEILPLIAIDKTADKSILNDGPGTVAYSYQVSNTGTTDLATVVVSDDKISTVNYVSGDTNADLILQTSEVWLYTASMLINDTTTNTATVSAYAGSINVVDTDTFTVTVTIPEIIPAPVVTPEPEPVVTPEPEPVVAPEPEPVTEPIVTPTEGAAEDVAEDTILDGVLPATATPLLLYLTSGLGFMLLGFMGLKKNKKI